MTPSGAAIVISHRKRFWLSEIKVMMTIVLPRGENTTCHQKMKKISVCLSASSRSQ